MTDTTAKEQAILRLISERDPRVLRNILASAEEWNRVAPVRFVGSLTVLNPVLDAMIDDPEEFARIAAIVDTRRDAAGLEWMWPSESPDKFDRVANQRRLMRERRERTGRAWRLHNASLREDQKIFGAARLEFERKVGLKWGRMLADKISKVRANAPGGRLSKEVERAIRTEYWARIDAELDEQENALRREGKI